jgi:hypothetical protein
MRRGSVAPPANDTAGSFGSADVAGDGPGARMAADGRSPTLAGNRWPALRRMGSSGVDLEPDAILP